MAEIFDYIKEGDLKKAWGSLSAEEQKVWDNYDSFRDAKINNFQNLVGYQKVDLSDFEKIKPVLTREEKKEKRLAAARGRQAEYEAEDLERSNLAWGLVEENLESLGTFEQKKRYIDEHEYISQAMEKLPRFKEMVNSYMVGNVVSEFGNPDAPGFSFSKKYSDEFLLDKLDLIEKNKEVLSDYFGGERGVQRLERDLRKRNVEYSEAKGTVENLREAILQKRKEFDERTSWMRGPGEEKAFMPPSFAVNPFALTTTIGKIAVQPANLVEAFIAPEGLETIESRKFNWDPINKRYGPGPEIPALQEKLRGAYEEMNETVPQQYAGKSAKYKEYQDMVLSDKSNRAIVESTGLDEALHYLDMESLKSMLQGE